MLSRRTLLVAAAALAAASSSAFASEAYDAAAFKAAQKAGKPILVDIAASWCPTCQAQKPIIQGLVGGKYKNFVVLEVDFDAQKDVVRAFGARMQSTLIVFNGAKEVGRSVGETDPAKIEALLASAL
jgi:thioredoxin-like negative regulator of GroEL